MRIHTGILAAATAIVSLLGSTRPARADGAFPDSLNVLVPADRPSFIALTTNFGIISSLDSGASWTWVCESPSTSCSMLYSVGASPADRLFAVAADALVYSDDDACHWKVSGGVVSSGGVVDAFPLARDASRVLAIVSPNGVGAQTTYTIVLSSNGGASFDAVLFTASAGDVVTGVEAARGDEQHLFATLARGSGFTPALAVSDDGGAHWREVDLSPQLAAAGIRLVAVDRTNPSRVFLRVSMADAEALAVFDATNDTLTTPLTFPGGLMTAFAQTDEGPLIVAGRLNAAASVHRSLDGGATWREVPGAPHLRALAERAGELYGAADDVADGFALAVSKDLGVSFHPLLRFAEVGSIAACVRDQCQETCRAEVATGLWPASMCTAAPEVKPKASSSGCALAAAPRASLAALGLALMMLLARRPRAR
ncbi:MAG: hypothetical protein JWM82_1530 [Myxococcales bacterium]|nr:hypothetical protein [Myxococcales bacterium]